MDVLRKKISQSYYSVTALAGIRKDDVFLISFPKSGNTWVKFVLLNILMEAGNLDTKASFKTLDETIPELSRDNLLIKWKYNVLPRFIKSHLSYSRFFFHHNKALLIVRDPRDVMVSYFHFVTNSYGYNFTGTFSQFIQHQKFGLEACIRHQVSWQHRAAATIKYEDLKNHGADVLFVAMQQLSININREILEAAFQNASFDKMKLLEQGPKKYTSTHKQEYNFMRKGTGNQWPDYFTEKDTAYYHSLLNKYHNSYTNLYEY